MSRYLFAALTALSMCSAHAGPSQDQYQTLGHFSGQLRECYENELVTPQFYAASLRAISQMIAVARFDQGVIQNLENDAYLATTATPQLCRGVETSGYQLQSIANQAVANHNAGVDANRQAAQNFGNSIPRPVWCNRIGDTTMCN